MKEINLSIYKIDKEAIQGKGEIIYLFGRDEKRTKHIITIKDIKPYFYVDSKMAIPKDSRISLIEKGFKSYNKKDVIKINVINSFDVGSDNHIGVKHHFNINSQYESDIPYTLRVKLNLGIKCGVNIKFNDI